MVAYLDIIWMRMLWITEVKIDLIVNMMHGKLMTTAQFFGNLLNIIWNIFENYKFASKIKIGEFIEIQTYFNSNK